MQVARAYTVGCEVHDDIVQIEIDIIIGIRYCFESDVSVCDRHIGKGNIKGFNSVGNRAGNGVQTDEEGCIGGVGNVSHHQLVGNRGTLQVESHLQRVQRIYGFLKLGHNGYAARTGTRVEIQGSVSRRGTAVSNINGTAY